MPNIPTNSVYGYALEFANEAANTNRINAGTDAVREQTKATILETMMRKQAFDSQQQYQQALRQKAATENAAEGMTLAASKDPSNEDPSTKPLADSSQPVDPITRQINAIRKEQAELKSQSQTAQSFGQDAKPFLTRLGQTESELGRLVLEQQKETVRKQQQAAQSIGAIEDSDSLKEAMDLIKDTDPRMARQLEQKLPRAPDGSFVWNDQAKKVLAPVYSQFISGYQQGELKQRGLDYKLNQDKLEQKKVEDRETARFHDKEVAARYAGIAAAGARQDKALAAAGLKVDTKVLSAASKDIETISKDYQFPQYQHSADVATRIEDKLTDPKKGYEAVSTANARELVEQFKLSADNYRRQGGGKYTETQINKMNSTLDKLEKFTTTIGEGDKLLAKDVMLSTARAIKDLYTDQAVNVAKKELRAADILKRKGQDPTLVDYNAIPNIDKLERAGAAKQITMDGKKYVAFGKNKEDIFELPSPPDRSKALLTVGSE